MHIYLYTSYI